MIRRICVVSALYSSNRYHRIRLQLSNTEKSRQITPKGTFSLCTSFEISTHQPANSYFVMLRALMMRIIIAIGMAISVPMDVFRIAILTSRHSLWGLPDVRRQRLRRRYLQKNRQLYFEGCSCSLGLMAMWNAYRRGCGAHIGVVRRRCKYCWELHQSQEIQNGVRAMKSMPQWSVGV